MNKYEEHTQPGMSLLDYFAGQALMGWVASSNRHGLWGDAAEESYKYATEMLAERAKLKEARNEK